jgi:hypothetical protein
MKIGPRIMLHFFGFYATVFVQGKFKNQEEQNNQFAV